LGALAGFSAGAAAGAAVSAAGCSASGLAAFFGFSAFWSPIAVIRRIVCCWR
jgi:hypothetical protein